MANICPQCQCPVPVFKIRPELACPSCGAQLTAPSVAPFLTVFVLWSVADFVLMVMLEPLSQASDTLGMAIRILVSAIVGAALYWRVYSSVTLSANTPKGNDAS